MYTVIATWFVKDDVERAIAALTALAAAVHAEEPGTLGYLVHEVKRSSLPPPATGTIVFVEIYRDERAFLDHLHGKAFTEFTARHKDLFVFDSNGNPYLQVTNLHRIAGFVREPIAPAR